MLTPIETQEKLLAQSSRCLPETQALRLGWGSEDWERVLGRCCCPPSAPHLLPCPRDAGAAETPALEPFCPPGSLGGLAGGGFGREGETPTALWLSGRVPKTSYRSSWAVSSPAEWGRRAH